MTQEEARLKTRKAYLKKLPKEIVEAERLRVKELKQALIDKGISQREVAEMLNINRNSIIQKLNFDTDFKVVEMEIIKERLRDE
jgi:DNA-binding transcriptional regulator LsrR (DeoR family)